MIDLARARELTLCTSVPLLAELAEVIARAKFAGRVRAAGLAAADLVADYGSLAETVVPGALPGPVSRDPDDDLVLATALGAEVSFIVFGDRDLLDLGRFADIPIVAATDALAAINR